MNEILIIGTEPPCPRCGLLTHFIEKKVEELGLDVEVRHLNYLGEEAGNFARSQGLKVGTAKDVAVSIKKEIDKTQLTGLLTGGVSAKVNEYAAYNKSNWSYELDEFLRPFEEKATAVGIMMIPVIVINGELKHQGSVPEMGKILEWLLQLK
ncbi:Thioredoxin domain-containing protein [Draconibacterium orientale]|uniref:Thioredoxin domain-containing protein n=1 Tax=Draconibacterium orientale TaxID=1168034 RepID=X5DJY3_9BACT|nr:thioredoxin family protein [Draconibacterium orientale]AHW61464.1 hypothetical protein FH5T_01540 [Draconibacterium orientale]SET11030.1 Thioredoxin domain-containing protein [Draconibacterium orientale]